MRTRDRKASSKVGLEPVTASGRNSASDALRQEAERGWARVRPEAPRGGFRRSGAIKGAARRERDAEIQRLRQAGTGNG